MWWPGIILVMLKVELEITEEGREMGFLSTLGFWSSLLRSLDLKACGIYRQSYPISCLVGKSGCKPLS